MLERERELTCVTHFCDAEVVVNGESRVASEKALLVTTRHVHKLSPFFVVCVVVLEPHVPCSLSSPHQHERIVSSTICFLMASLRPLFHPLPLALDSNPRNKIHAPRQALPSFKVHLERGSRWCSHCCHGERGNWGQPTRRH